MNETHLLTVIFIWLSLVITFVIYQGWWEKPLSFNLPTAFLLLTAATMGNSSFSWLDLTTVIEIRFIVLAAATALAWKYVTRDFALSGAQFSIPERVALILCTFFLFWSPLTLFPLLVFLHRRSRIINTCLHEKLAIRVLLSSAVVLTIKIALTKFVLQEVISQTVFDRTLVTILLSAIGSLYFRSGVGKIQAGRKWTAWITQCQLHYQLVAAYTWGWLQWIPEKTLIRIARGLSKVNPLVASGVVLLEVGCIGLMTHREFAMVLLVGLALFHLGYFAYTGAFFWENILITLSGAYSLLLLSDARASSLFGSHQSLLYAIAMFGMAKAFRAVNLTWWEVPLIQRIYCQVKSGETVYTVDHRYMDPIEPLFYFGFSTLCPVKTVTINLTHTDLGQNIAEKIIATGPDPDAVAHLLPVRAGDNSALLPIEKLLVQIFTSLKEGKRKTMIPNALKWLKAPGSFLSSGGPAPRFYGQVIADEILIKYKECYFDGKVIHTLRDQVLHRISLTKPIV